LTNQKEILFMPVKDPKEVFVRLLSDVRRGAERSTKFFQEAGELAQNEDIKEALNARVFVQDSIVKRLDECFRLIGAQPVKLEGKLQDVLVEDFRRELAEIESPEAKRLYILAKVSHLMHLRMGEYVALIAAADLTGHYGVGVLLETCLADKLAFIERTRRLIRERIAQRVAAA
jgi:ferritin-like metal-binding protein YciE